MPLSPVLRLKADNIDAFEWIYQRYHQEIYRYFFRKLDSIQLCEDLVQDTFVKIWIYRKHLHDELDIGIQIFRIAKTVLIDVVRKHYYSKTVLLPIEQLPEGKLSKMEDLFPYEKIQELDFLLQALPERRKEVLMLKLQGYSNKEIASKLETSVRTVENHLQLAYRIIRKRAHLTPILLLLLRNMYMN